MSAVRLPCASRRRGHQHSVTWRENGTARTIVLDHANPLLWLNLARAELWQNLGRVSDLEFDGEAWKPNPRDGWSASAYLTVRAAMGDHAAERWQTEINREATRWSR